MRNECPTCGGDLATLGNLGDLFWFKCIRCGMECHSEISHQENDDDWYEWDDWDDWDDEDFNRDDERYY